MINVELHFSFFFRKKKGSFSASGDQTVGGFPTNSASTGGGKSYSDHGGSGTTGTESDNAKTSTPVLGITGDESEGGAVGVGSIGESMAAGAATLGGSAVGKKGGDKMTSRVTSQFSASGDTPLSCIEPLTGPFSEDKPYVVAYADLVSFESPKMILSSLKKIVF